MEKQIITEQLHTSTQDYSYVTLLDLGFSPDQAWDAVFSPSSARIADLLSDDSFDTDWVPSEEDLLNSAVSCYL